MKTQRRFPKFCMWILLVFVLSEFVFFAYNWLSYCSPIEAVRFVLSGQWFNEPFFRGGAGLALDQPTVGKFLLWTSVMTCLACTTILLLHTVVPAARQAARQCVNVCAVLLVALVLIELLLPTFLLVQYVLSMGITLRRFLGLCLCCGFWILLPSIAFWIRKANSTETRWVKSPLTWALACSLIVPTYYVSVMLRPSMWRHWNTESIAFLLAWIVLVAPMPCIIWLRRWELHSMKHDTENHRTMAPTTT